MKVDVGLAPLGMPAFRMLGLLAVPCMLFMVIFAMACTPQVYGEAKDAKAEAGGASDWELVFTDTFDREELGENWKVVDGVWELEDGALVGSGTLISTRGFPGPEPHRQIPGEAPPGFIRLEFEARTEVRGLDLMPGSGAPQVSVSDLSAFIHAEPYDPDTSPLMTGYFFQFGGFMNTYNAIKRKGDVLVEQEEPAVLITPDKLHKIAVENDEGSLRITVDGETLMERSEPASIMGDGFDRVGLYFYTNTRVESVRVYVKRLSEGYF